MNIDMAALHAIESERGIPEGELLETIKTALLTAYRHTEGHQAEARIDIDRKTGEVRVMAAEHDDDGRLISEFDDTPDGFGRVAATTREWNAHGNPSGRRCLLHTDVAGQHDSVGKRQASLGRNALKHADGCIQVCRVVDCP